MTSAQAVAKKIRDLKISDKDFLTSRAMRGYLASLLSVPCRTISKVVPPIEICYETSADSPAAYTDFRKIVLNAACNLVRVGKNRVQKVKCLMGMMVHEYGHYRFTDSAGIASAVTRLSDGQFYPVPQKLTEELQENLEDFSVYFEGNKNRHRQIINAWKEIQNIMEDAYIEECCFRTLSGQLIDALSYTRRVAKKTAPTLSEMLVEIERDRTVLLPVTMAVLLMYAKYGEVKCNYSKPEERFSEPMKLLKKCRPYTDAMLYESRVAKRMDGVNKVFLTLWPTIRENLEARDPEEDGDAFSDDMRRFCGEMGSEEASGPMTKKGIPVTADEDTGESGSAKARKHLEDELEEGTEEGSSGDEDGDEPDGDGISDSDDGDEGVASPLEDGDGVVMREEIEDSEVDDDKLSAALSRVEKDAREEIAIEEVNKELTDGLRKEASSLDYGAAHRGIKTLVERISSVGEDKRAIYASSTDAIEAIATAMAKKILPIIKKDSDVEKMSMSGYFSGTRFDATRLVYRDYRYFKQGVTPAPDTRLALSILVDESGSMSCGGRIEAARTAALALYLFCEKTGIKCSVIGHTAPFSEGYYRDGCKVLDYGDLQLNAYADFETPDRDDKYRILNISAKQDNRDGAAILFAGEHLLKRCEPTKIMIVISDGAPCARDYDGLAAENDMTNIVMELRRKGVIVFAAAIGGDKENIQRIYKEGFIDITDLATLPNQLLQLIKRYIR